MPELQRLELLGKTALAVVKYLPLPASLATQAAAVLTAAPAADPWSARAAALVFAQYFWFRHAHLLSREDNERLQACSLCDRVFMREWSGCTQAALPPPPTKRQLDCLIASAWISLRQAD